jgi:hypothetical protein
MAQDGKMGSKDAPPFATADGKQTVSGDQGATKGVDFTKDATPQDGYAKGIDFNATGHRAQSTGKKEVAPAAEGIPSGGPVLELDPTGEEKSGNSGAITPVSGGSDPWKNLK